ncbi:MAG: polysaccharide biosynthesis/export family protein [Flavobacteriales bacterium]
MKNSSIILFALIFFFSCSHKKQLTYLSDVKQSSINKVNFYLENNLEIGDVLKIDIYTVIPEVSVPYNNFNKESMSNNIDLLVVEGFLVDKDSLINYPVLGQINVVGFTEKELASKIKKLLVKGGHLNNPYVKVKKINSKFTVLGEVRNPGTYNNYDNQLNIFQAIGFAGDLLITAKKENILLLREENGLRKTYKFALNKQEILDKPFYYIKSNDVIIVEPNFSKIKSAGFIGSPSSIASISSLLLSITLLLINN